MTDAPGTGGRPTDPAAQDDLPRTRRRDRPRRTRVAATLAYDGSGFHGFQRQPGVPTVEQALVEALAAAGFGEGLSFAGRTDRGVHAAGQVVCFRVPAGTDLGNARTLVQQGLPGSITLGDLHLAPAGFHPRWSASGKRYRYRLTRTATPRAWTPPTFPDISRLALAAAALAGCPALDGFTGAGGSDSSAPPLLRLGCVAENEGISLVFEGPAFRRYAIRHMVATLVAEATGGLESGACVRVAATAPPYQGPRAPGDGLVLEQVSYPPALDPFAQR